MRVERFLKVKSSGLREYGGKRKKVLADEIRLRQHPVEGDGHQDKEQRIAGESWARSLMTKKLRLPYPARKAAAGDAEQVLRAVNL